MNTLARHLLVSAAAAVLTLPTFAQTDAKPEEKPASPPKPKQVANPPFGMFKETKLPMIQRSVLNGVEGRIDHMGVDLISGRLYVAAKNKGSLEMLDVDGSKQQPAITDLPEPSGIAVVSDMRRLVVTCSGDNSARVYKLNDAGDPTPHQTVKFEGEADPVRYDPASKRVYVGHGRQLGSFALESGERGPSLELPGAPEGFVIDPSSDKIYVNIAQQGTVAVLTRTDKGELKLETTWTIKDHKGNYAMALDPSNGHLFVACRNPARLIVLDTKTGAQAAAVECTDDADDCWWDAAQKRIYISCGGSGGFVDCYQQQSESGKVTGYKRYHQEKTNVGCRTSIFIPEHRRLIVAAPKLGADPTFIYVFIVGP